MSTLLRDLDAFVQEHGRCGDLDGGIWMTCTCGATISRNVSAPWSASTP